MNSDHPPEPDPQLAFDVARQVCRLRALQPRQMGSLLLDAFDAWSADNAGHMGAALAYYALFSIAPILVVVMGIVGLVYGPSAAQGRIAPWLTQFLGSEGARTAQFMVAQASSPTDGIIATVAGVIGIFFGASAVVNDLRNSLNVIWKVSSCTTQTTSVLAAIRDVCSARLYAFVIVFGVGVVSVFVVVTAALIAAVGAHFRASLPLPELVLQALSFIVAMALTTTMFTLVYKTVPDASVSWGDAVIGATVTALLFNLGGVLLSMVVGKTAASVYGAAGSVIALLLWVYYSAQLFFFGAELTRIFANRFGGQVIPRPHVWRDVLRHPMHSG
jgi:membrane protein